MIDLKERLENILTLKTDSQVIDAIDKAMDEQRGILNGTVDQLTSCINMMLDYTEFKTVKNRKEVETDICNYIENVEMLIDDGIIHEIHFKNRR